MKSRFLASTIFLVLLGFFSTQMFGNSQVVATSDQETTITATTINDMMAPPAKTDEVNAVVVDHFKVAADISSTVNLERYHPCLENHAAENHIHAALNHQCDNEGDLHPVTMVTDDFHQGNAGELVDENIAVNNDNAQTAPFCGDKSTYAVSGVISQVRVSNLVSGANLWRANPLAINVNHNSLVNITLTNTEAMYSGSHAFEVQCYVGTPFSGHRWRVIPAIRSSRNASRVSKHPIDAASFSGNHQTTTTMVYSINVMDLSVTNAKANSAMATEGYAEGVVACFENEVLSGAFERASPGSAQIVATPPVITHKANGERGITTKTAATNIRQAAVV